MDLHLTGKVVVITGGGTGIGKATAEAFAREGAKVVICGRRLEKLEQTQTEFRAEGLEIAIRQLDVCDIAAVQALADEIAATYGSIDVWVNNAGIAINKPVLDFTDEDYDRIMQTNLRSVYEGSRIAGRQMIRQGTGGVIINASSYASKIPHANGTIYAATKAAVSNMTKTFAANFAPYGIRVVGFIPGMIVTEISEDEVRKHEAHFVQNVALKRLGKPADMAKPIVFLASDACGYVTGVDLEVSGGKYVVQNAMEPWKWKDEA